MEVTAIKITPDGDLIEMASPGRTKLELNQFVRNVFSTNKDSTLLRNERVSLPPSDLEVWYDQNSTEPLNEKSYSILGKAVKGNIIVATRNPNPAVVAIASRKYFPKGEFVDTDVLWIKDLVSLHKEKIKQEKKREKERMQRKRLIIKIRIPKDKKKKMKVINCESILT